MLKDILEHAIPITLQDVVVIFCNVTGWQEGRFVQWSDARKIYNQTDRRPDLERDPDHHRRRGLCAALDLHVAGRLPSTRLRQAGADRLERLPRQPLRPLLLQPGGHSLQPASKRRRSNEAPVIGRLASRRRIPCISPIRPLLDRLEVPATPAAVAVGGRWQAGGGAELEVRSPIDGSLLAGVSRRRSRPPLRWSARGRARPARHFRCWQRCPPRGAASSSAASASGFAPSQGRPGRAGELGGRQDHPGGAGRSPGNDRHVRLRRGTEPATLRPDDRQRAAAAPPGRTVASAGAGGRDHGLQFSRGRLGLERDARPGLRRCGGLEAVGEDARCAPWPARPLPRRRDGRNARCAAGTCWAWSSAAADVGQAAGRLARPCR